MDATDPIEGMGMPTRGPSKTGVVEVEHSSEAKSTSQASMAAWRENARGTGSRMTPSWCEGSQLPASPGGVEGQQAQMRPRGASTTDTAHA